MNGADQHWLDEYRNLPNLHVRKSATYGTDVDRFANFTAVAQITGEPVELYVLKRLLEKTVRAILMVKDGQGDDVREYSDISSLALVCAALQRKRTVPADLLPRDEPRAA